MAWLAAACLALVVVGGGAGVQYYQANAVASVISLDVNPSVELDVNRQEKGVSAVPLNADANEILDGMDLKGADLNVAVNAIMGSLLKHGYVDELANSILISVEDRQVLDAALTALADDERQIVLLHAVTGWKHREIAGLLELPLSTVLSKYRRALLKLKTKLEGGDAL